MMEKFIEIQADGSKDLVTAYWIESRGWIVVKREVDNETR